MIFVDRSKIPAPDILTDPNKSGPKETLRAIAHYTGPNANTPFNFKVYSSHEVKEALNELFKGKCAYCESTVLHIYPGDVEHFRPKGEITEAPQPRPGYYWLAADWDNLLFSCRNCNQQLSHNIHAVAKLQTMGKMNQFPLANETRRVRIHNNPTGINDEEDYRLLLNPCLDMPETHLQYDENSGVIKPKRINGAYSSKAIESIKVYVLQRVPLVLAREKVLIEIQAQIQRVKEAVKNYNENIDDPSTVKKFYFEKILKRELERLKKFTNEEEQYVGMARQIIKSFLRINFGILI